MNIVEALTTAVARIEDLLKNDDPQAWKEAERVLPQLREAVAKAAPAVPQGMRLAPIWLLERVEQSLGSFTSDEGWSQADMDTMDSVSALLAAPSQPVMQGEPVAQVSDLFPSIRTKLYEMGFEPESPLYTAPADGPATPPYHRDLWGISHAIARINEAEYIATFTLDQDPVTLTDDGARRVALSIIEDLECRKGLMDGVDDDVKQEMLDSFARAIIAALREKSGGE